MWLVWVNKCRFCLKKKKKKVVAMGHMFQYLRINAKLRTHWELRGNPGPCMIVTEIPHTSYATTLAYPSQYWYLLQGTVEVHYSIRRWGQHPWGCQTYLSICMMWNPVNGVTNCLRISKRITYCDAPVYLGAVVLLNVQKPVWLVKCWRSDLDR